MDGTCPHLLQGLLETSEKHLAAAREMAGMRLLRLSAALLWQDLSLLQQAQLAEMERLVARHAAERGLENLEIGLECAALKRLKVRVEVVFSDHQHNAAVVDFLRHSGAKNLTLTLGVWTAPGTAPLPAGSDVRSTARRARDVDVRDPVAAPHERVDDAAPDAARAAGHEHALRRARKPVAATAALMAALGMARASTAPASASRASPTTTARCACARATARATASATTRRATATRAGAAPAAVRFELSRAAALKLRAFPAPGGGSGGDTPPLSPWWAGALLLLALALLLYHARRLSESIAFHYASGATHEPRVHLRSTSTDPY